MIRERFEVKMKRASAKKKKEATLRDVDRDVRSAGKYRINITGIEPLGRP